MPALFIKKEKWEEFLKHKKIVEEFLDKNKESNPLIIEAWKGMYQIIDEELERNRVNSRYVTSPTFITGLVREKVVKNSTKPKQELGFSDSPKEGDRVVRFILDYNNSSVYLFEWVDRENFQKLVDSILVGNKYEFECRKNRIQLWEIMRINQQLPN